MIGDLIDGTFAWSKRQRCAAVSGASTASAVITEAKRNGALNVMVKKGGV